VINFQVVERDVDQADKLVLNYSEEKNDPSGQDRNDTEPIFARLAFLNIDQTLIETHLDIFSQL